VAPHYTRVEVMAAQEVVAVPAVVMHALGLKVTIDL
jgi:hypothetical protein